MMRSRGYGDRILLAFFASCLLCMVLWHAAVTEDAYITFRVVDNFTHGYGLRWNIDERVQAYTNPLWLLLHIPFYAVWENIFYITLGLSLLCTAGAVALSIYTFEKPALQSVSLFLVPLIVSKTFADYATSGLENPLSYLLFAGFGWALLRADKQRFWFWITGFCALAMVNRLDTVILYAPVLIWLVWVRFKNVRWGQCLVAALPLVAWECFSLIYYGFLFPNTKYAKLNAGIPQAAYIQQGLHYLANLVAVDAPSALFLAAAVLLPFWAQRARRPELVALSLGVLAYSAYVVWVGGNHVSGRFWSLPVFASIWLVCAAAHNIGKYWQMGIIAALALLFALYPSINQLRMECPYCFTGDIRPTGDRYTLRDQIHGAQTLPAVDRFSLSSVRVSGGLGFYGYEAGPRVHIIDPLALSDALLARLPAASQYIGRIGHLKRAIPAGYADAIETGDTALMNSALAQYYNPLHSIISGDIWSVDRFAEIFKFNLGYYDEFRNDYIKQENHDAHYP